jgi:hypothetical protein
VQDNDCEDDPDRLVISFDGDGVEAIIKATEATEAERRAGPAQSE